VSCSSDVVPEIREYERTSTTTANVYVMPLMSRYLDDLERKLQGLGIPGRLYVMMSAGGIATPETAKRVPIRLVESGPAAGALAATRMARQAAWTACCPSTWAAPPPRRASSTAASPCSRASSRSRGRIGSRRARGLPIRVPVVELDRDRGGRAAPSPGWIAWGCSSVGPDSAGADPGPACYGLGGREPTVTDCRPPPGLSRRGLLPWAGRMRLNVEAARRAVDERVARPMGLELTEAAWGIHRVVNENMAGAARVHGIERGKDLRGYPLFAFGGAGPVHAWQVGRILRVPRVLVPFGAGALSAYGLLAAPLAFDFVRTAPQRMAAADWAQINRLFEEMETEGSPHRPRRRVGRTGATRRHRAPRRRGCATGPGTTRWTGEDPGRPAGARQPGGDHRLVRDRLPPPLYSRTPQGVPLEALNWRAVVSGYAVRILTITGRVMASGSTAALGSQETSARLLSRNPGLRRRPRCTTATASARRAPRRTAIVEERGVHHRHRPGRGDHGDAHRTLIAEPAARRRGDGSDHARHLLGTA